MDKQCIWNCGLLSEDSTIAVCCIFNLLKVQEMSCIIIDGQSQNDEIICSKKTERTASIP